MHLAILFVLLRAIVKHILVRIRRLITSTPVRLANRDRCILLYSIQLDFDEIIVERFDGGGFLALPLRL